jgi:hypothetical protein
MLWVAGRQLDLMTCVDSGGVPSGFNEFDEKIEVAGYCC